MEQEIKYFHLLNVNKEMNINKKNKKKKERNLFLLSKNNQFDLLFFFIIIKIIKKIKYTLIIFLLKLKQFVLLKVLIEYLQDVDLLLYLN